MQKHISADISVTNDNQEALHSALSFIK